MPEEPASQVRRLREERGLTQVALAEAAAVSRQSLSAIEAGRADPSVSLALRLARALDCSVEDLFDVAADGPELDVELAGQRERAASPERVAMAFVGERWVAHRLPTDSLEMASQSADALTVPSSRARGQRTRVELLRPPAEARETLVMLGCAPALGLLASRLNGRTGPGRFLWLKHSSTAALDALKREHAHVGGVHLPAAASAPPANRAAVRQTLPGARMSIVTLVQWEAGLLVARGNPAGIRDLTDLARRGLRIASREPGAGTRLLLEQALRAVRLAPSKILRGALELAGHLEVAQAVSIGAADVGIAMRPAALAFGLGFIPLALERFDLVFARDHVDDARMVRLLDTMSSAAFRRELDALGGYDTACCGSVVE